MTKNIIVLIYTLLLTSNLYSQDLSSMLHYIGSVENTVSIDLIKAKEDCLKSSICNEDTHLSKLIELNSLFKNNPISASTGFFVRINDEQRVITTNHSVTEKIKDYEANIENFKNIFPLPFSIKIKIHFKTKYMTYETLEKKCDSKRDICSLNLKYPTGIGFDLKKCSLKPGDKVTIIGNPKAIFSSTNNFFISYGIFLGYDKDEDINLNAKIYLGSSGSPIILNNNVCGIIKGYSKVIRELSYGTQLKYVIELFD